MAIIIPINIPIIISKKIIIMFLSFNIFSHLFLLRFFLLSPKAFLSLIINDFFFSYLLEHFV